MQQLGWEDPQAGRGVLQQNLRQHQVGDVLARTAVDDFDGPPGDDQLVEFVVGEVTARGAVVEPPIGVLLDAEDSVGVGAGRAGHG